MTNSDKLYENLLELRKLLLSIVKDKTFLFIVYLFIIFIRMLFTL